MPNPGIYPLAKPACFCFEQRLPDGELLWLGVGEEGVALLQHSSLQLLAKYPYAAIVTFGGCQVIRRDKKVGL